MHDSKTPALENRIPFETAIGWIERQLGPLGPMIVPVVSAVGDVLAEPAVAIADVPPWDRAAIDGIAVRAEETIGASIYNPVSLRLVSTCDTLPALGAVCVNAGEPLPGDADAVIPLEYVSLDVAATGEIVESVVSGSEVERAGSHAVRDAVLLPAGRRLRPHDIALLISAGVARIPVIRRPEVRVVVAGSGMRQANAATSLSATYDADGPLLRALIERDSGILADLRHIDRDQRTLCDALSAHGPDIILVAGSTGHGANDHAAAALAEVGELAIHGVALHPGESTSIGRVGASLPVILLPGAPAACIWAYELFAGRAIRRLAGRNPALPFRSKQMRTSRKIVSGIGVTEICPVRCLNTDDVEPIASFAEAGLMAAVRADGFVIVPEDREGFAEGATVTVYLQEEHDGLPAPKSAGPRPRP